MIILIIGNIIALIASLIMVYSGTLKNKKKIVYFQGIQIGLLVISNLVLGGISGAIINVISLIRNILCYMDKLKTKEKIVISLLATILMLKFNNSGFLGYLLLISTVAYIWLMNIKNVIKFKLLIVFTMIIWFIYDLAIKSYTSAVFDAIAMIVNLITIFRIKNNNNYRITQTNK